MATELEKQMAELMAGVDVLGEGTKKVQNDAAKARRKSRELDELFEDMSAVQQNWSATAALRSRTRRQSKEFADDDLKLTFDELDTDKSGKLNRDEIRAAIKKVDPDASDDKVEEMVKFADKNGDGEIDFEEFKKAVTTKPAEAPAPAP